MIDVMVDLETLGQRPGCSILSIGAVAFDPIKGVLGNSFYAVVNRQSCVDAKLHENDETIAWWEKQSTEAKMVLAEAASTQTTLAQALDHFTAWLHPMGLSQVKVWGNGSDFDNTILQACYEAVGQSLPWKFWNNRCYRTLKGLHPEVQLSRQGTYHNALDDAKTQAQHALEIFKHRANARS